MPARLRCRCSEGHAEMVHACMQLSSTAGLQPREQHCLWACPRWALEYAESTTSPEDSTAREHHPA